MIDTGEDFGRFRPGNRLKRQRRLGGSRDHLLKSQSLRDGVGHAQARQPGLCQHDGCHFSLGHFVQSGPHISSDPDYLDIGSEST